MSKRKVIWYSVDISRGGTPYNGLYRLQVYERVGILAVELYEREGKSVILVCKKKRCIFMAVKTFCFYDCAYFRDCEFAAAKRDLKFLTRCVKGEPFVNIRYTKGVPFL